jgi:hypothetical protein
VLRRILAFLAYNVYSGALVWAFQMNTAYEFDPEMVKRLAGGDEDSPSHWGWGNHYLWRLCAAIVANLFAGVLTGAIARSRGGLTAAVSNIPAAIVAMLLIYYLSASPAITYGDLILTQHTGMIVCTALSIPLTTYFAYVTGETGARIQRENYSSESVLGIAGYHWVWLVIPVYLYAVVGIVPLMNFLKFDFLRGDEGLLSGAVGFVLFVTAIASFGPLIWVYQTLTKPATSFASAVRRALLNTGALGFGLLVVALVQLASQKLLGSVASLWGRA